MAAWVLTGLAARHVRGELHHSAKRLRHRNWHIRPVIARLLAATHGNHAAQCSNPHPYALTSHMDRYERILTLHRLLKSAHYPIPLSRLLSELECSRATLYRDVAFLRDALGAPIESAGGEQAAFRYEVG